MSKKNIIVTLHGMDIKTDTVYEVIEKKDTSAPDGFIREGTTKLLSSDVEDSINLAVFKGSYWDTGMYENSPGLRTAIGKEADIQVALKNINKYIVEPVEATIGEGQLSHLPKNTYWDEVSVRVYRGQIFNTANPQELMALFMLLLHKQLAPIDKQSHPDFKDPLLAQFCVEDREEVVDRTQRKQKLRDDAAYEFGHLLRTEKKQLGYVFQWLGIGSVAQADDAVLHSVYNKFIDDDTNGSQNIELFLKTIEEVKTDEGLEKLHTHSKLLELESKSKLKIKRNEIYIDDTVFLGRSFKEAANKIMKDKEVYEVFVKVIAESNK